MLLVTPEMDAEIKRGMAVRLERDEKINAIIAMRDSSMSKKIERDALKGRIVKLLGLTDDEFDILWPI